VVTENDHQERPWAFFAPAKCLWFRELEAQIKSNSCPELKHATLFEWRYDLNMNFSGTTKSMSELDAIADEINNARDKIRWYVRRCMFTVNCLQTASNTRCSSTAINGVALHF
jgi:hypothetical protein